MLKAPEDIYCFQFSPSDPNIIAGGCVDGQVFCSLKIKLYISVFSSIIKIRVKRYTTQRDRIQMPQSPEALLPEDEAMSGYSIAEPLLYDAFL